MSKPLNIQIVERARSLIEKEEHWCRGTLAMDARGNAVCPNSCRGQATMRPRCRNRGGARVHERLQTSLRSGH